MCADTTPAIQDTTFGAILDSLPPEERYQVVAHQLAQDADLERELRRSEAAEDAADRQSARRMGMITLCCGWTVVVVTIAGALLGIHYTTEEWQAWSFAAVASIGVGGPAAISLLARNTRVNISLHGDTPAETKAASEGAAGS